MVDELICAPGVLVNRRRYRVPRWRREKLGLLCVSQMEYFPIAAKKLIDLGCLPLRCCLLKF